jgi:hypothetical protein
MTGQTQAALRALHGDTGSGYLMAVRTVTAFHRLVDHFFKESRFAGTVWRMTVNTMILYREILVGGTKFISI